MIQEWCCPVLVWVCLDESTNSLAQSNSVEFDKTAKQQTGQTHSRITHVSMLESIIDSSIYNV